MTVTKMVLIRHGESIWNQENRFTGWTDVDLSPQGLLEAQQAGRLLYEQGFKFDYAFTSLLKRAIRTLWSILDELDLLWIPVEKSWRLNERHYGSLQGLDKKETVQQFGAEQVQQWRRSFAIAPPPLERNDVRFPCNDPRYATLTRKEIPTTESLATTVQRVVPYWQKVILPRLQQGDRVIIAAHGNSLRALVQHLDKLSEEQVLNLNIPTGIPLVYSFNEMMKPLEHHYLGDQMAIAAKIQSVAHQSR